MRSAVDDALVVCLVAACLVVVAHGVDAAGSRRHEDGWWHSLALALCGLALCLPAVRLTFVESMSDVMLLLATAVAVTVSAMPLVGWHRGAAGERERPANPWDRAYRIHPARVAQLLSPGRPTPSSPPAESAPGAGPHSPGRTVTPSPAALRGTVVDVGSPAPRPAAQERAEPTHPRLAGPRHEAADALHDVDDVVDDVTHLLGLDRDRRPPR